MSEVKFALYASSVEGHAVTRYSSHKMGKRPLLIGATRDHKDPTRITWHTDRIIGIPEAEYSRFRREYEREIRAGGLRRRSAQEYEAQAKVDAEAAQKATEAAQKITVVSGTVLTMNGIPGPGTQISDGQLPGAPPIPPAIHTGDEVMS